MTGDEPRGWTPAGSFVFRTPLLPFDEFLAWGDGLEAPAAAHDAERLACALGRDRERLRARLYAAFSRAELREALFVASPDLHAALERRERVDEPENDDRLDGALARYWTRMTTRPTPFGLFAGISAGRLGTATRLRLPALAAYRRRTRLDMNYLSALVERLAQEPALRASLTYRPNSSLYPAAGGLRFVKSRMNGPLRVYTLSGLPRTNYLDAVLARASEGASVGELTDVLTSDRIEPAMAANYVSRLIDSQILVPNLALPITGPGPSRQLLADLRRHPEASGAMDVLGRVEDALDALDRSGPGADPEAYHAVARALEPLSPTAGTRSLFQVDLVKPAEGASLGEAVLAEMRAALELLEGFAAPANYYAMRLTEFRRAFSDRYGEAEIPLSEALDEDTGVGFKASAEASPLLQGLGFSGRRAPPSVEWSDRQRYMLQRLAKALQDGDEEIVLTPVDRERLRSIDAQPLPDALAIIATLEARSEEAIARGEFRLYVHHAAGPSGVHVLGRFCHVDTQLEEWVGEFCRAEEALRPEAVFAEIVHLPQGRTGNVLARPVLREFEIPYLGRSGAPPERQLPVGDLLVSARHGRVVLRSRRLQREVIPRLTSAHVVGPLSLGVYRFLFALQHQDTANRPGWDWGALDEAPFLPRVRYGRLVLSLARWRAGGEELRSLTKPPGTERFRAIQTWREERQLPRFVALTDDDEGFAVDLDNAMSVDALVHLLRHRGEAVLTELFPPPDELCAAGPQGRFTHELVVPFLRRRDAPAPDPPPVAARGTAGAAFVPTTRHFAPGSEWLYVKLYTGSTMADALLRDVVGPLIRSAAEAGLLDEWFFLRYGDPQWHLRVRAHGPAERLNGELLPAWRDAVAPLLEDGRVWKMQAESYQPEIERYGGPIGVRLAEQVFHADSTAVLEILERVGRGDGGLDERWRLALAGMDLLLDDFGWDLPTRLTLLRELRASFAAEFRQDAAFHGRVGERFRRERAALGALLAGDAQANNTLATGLQALGRRSEAVCPLAAALHDAEQSGMLTRPVTMMAQSFLHMHANRMLRSAHRQQEWVLYEFLVRLYESRLARARRA